MICISAWQHWVGAEYQLLSLAGPCAPQFCTLTMLPDTDVKCHLPFIIINVPVNCLAVSFITVREIIFSRCHSLLLIFCYDILIWCHIFNIDNFIKHTYVHFFLQTYDIKYSFCLSTPPSLISNQSFHVTN